MYTELTHGPILQNNFKIYIEDTNYTEVQRGDFIIQFHTATSISQEGMGDLETLLSRTKTSINEPSAFIDHIP